MLSLILGLQVAHAGTVMGVDWVPAGRADEAWIAAEQLTGTLVAEGDGMLRPPLTAWAGWTGSRHGVLGSMDVARLATSVRTHDQEELSIRAAIRPAVDYRLYLKPVAVGDPLPYLQLGAYGVIPLATETSDSASKSELEVLDEQAKQGQSRIGALGLRLGLGAEHRWVSGILVGARYSMVYHRSHALDEETLTVSSMLRSEAALVIGVAL